ncbi:MFS transporter [Nocardia sp. 348MFTsu5.1]|uniref:MFS transporter n=1 Tax=Nocardia sp. 348MFTsu5.1 TaxID=1172185 RepID=UPI000381EF0D|nr:MFS transporter [Nocardia sp. 348MFTsu5.1]
MSDTTARSPRYLATLVAACLAVMVAQVAYSLPGSLNGTFQQEFNISGAELTWISAAFATAMVVFELTFGVLGDMFGRKRLMLGGAGLIVVGAALSASAQQVEVMWIGQIISGIGAGALYPISLAMIAAVVPDAQARAKAIALWAGFLSLGAAVSPMMAAALAEYASWRWAFGVVIAFALFSLVVSLGAQDSSSPEGRKLDIPGQVTLAVGLIALLWALTQGSEEGWGNAAIIAGFVIGALCLIAFVVIELRTEVPLLHLNLFANRAFAITGLTAVVGMFAFLGTCFSMSIWLGAVQHVSPLKIGLLFLVIQGPAFLLVPLVSRLIHSVSPRWVLTSGFGLMALAGYICSQFDVETSTWTDFIAPMLLLGIGFAFTVASITAVAINTVPLRLAGMASATTNLLRDFGFALGPVLVAAVANSVANGLLRDGLGAAAAQSNLGAAHTGAVMGIGEEGGAMALNSMPVIPVPTDPSQAPGPDNPMLQMPVAIKELALTSLGSGYSLGFLVCAVCAAASGVLTLVGLFGAKPESKLAADLGTDVLHEVAGVAGDVGADPDPRSKLRREDSSAAR